MDMNNDQDDDDYPRDLSNQQITQSPTLLPAPIANTISLVTRSSSLYLRLGSFIGGLALDGARVGTLTGLELSRALLEGILSRAGRDVTDRSTGELGRAQAENILERSIGTLHSTITAISFAASTGFYFSATALGSATDISQQLLASLDSILGSTDSSRAISSIITLIRREFQNPATGQEGEKVSVTDLLIGICGLALLQKWCLRITEAESQDEKHEELVWDVVVLTDGRRADVVENAQVARSRSTALLTPDGTQMLEAVAMNAMPGDEAENELSEISLKEKIIQSLPGTASVSITTETMTAKTITVEITGAHPPDLVLPSGVEVIEENVDDIDDSGRAEGIGQEIGQPIPRYRIVYRIVNNRHQETNIQSEGAIDDPVEAGHGAVIDLGDQPVELELPASPVSSPEIYPEISERLKSYSKAHGENQLNQDEDSKEISRTGFAPVHSPTSENTANQKRSRKPMSSSSSMSGSEKPPSKKVTGSKLPSVKKYKSENPPTKPPAKPTEKKSSFRNALKKGSGTTLSNLWNKDSGSETSLSKSPPSRPAWGVPNPPASKSHLPVPPRNSTIIPAREVPLPPQRGNPNYFSSRDLGVIQASDIPRSPSRASYYSIHERRRDSVVSHTDTYSIHSAETRPGSPTTFRTHLRAQSNLIRARSEKNIVSQPSSPARMHRRTKSHAPSIYTLNTNASATSLVLANRPRRSAFENSETLQGLSRTGSIQGLFPQHHIVRNITRFVRFASASYGSSFLRVMGIVASSSPEKREINTKHHHEHHSFSNHTQLPPDTILLSSFVDPAGGTDSSGHTGTGVPMVHFVSLDHESKAVVLTCRGTLGFEDVLTDMTCDYDSLQYRGKEYSVHKGIHASAKRLLDGGGGRVMATITAALEEFPDYGLVLCGHSLGGAVTSVVAIMISEPSPDPDSTAFVTSTNTSPRLLTSSTEECSTSPMRLHLPPGRPIHVYAYGPPATLSPSLRLETRGLITTIVNGQDLVPFLSLGVLHDLQAVALAFKNDDSGAKGEVRNRVWEGLKGGFADRWYNRTGESTGTTEDDQWAHSALKALRASMLSSKLVPPGEVFVVDSMPVLQRDAFTADKGLGRPATRSVLKYVRDVEKRFGEVRFGGSMLLSHSPGRYEASLLALGRGVLG